MHYKNRKPKAVVGCCWMCSLNRGKGLRCHREPTEQERAAEMTEREGILEHLEGEPWDGCGNPECEWCRDAPALPDALRPAPLRVPLSALAAR